MTSAATQTITLGPQPGPQTVMLSSDVDVALLGGMAGGGKTYALCLDACTRAYQDPAFSGVIFRRTYSELEQAGGPWPVARSIATLLGARAVKGDHELVFPNGARLVCRHMQHEKSRGLYQGGEYTYVGFDELEHFTVGQVSFLLGRMRSSAGLKCVMRLTTNPNIAWRPLVEPWLTDDCKLPDTADLPLGWLSFRDGVPKSVIGTACPGEGWQRFRVIPAKLGDNKILTDADPGYARKLAGLTAADRGRLLDGRWDVTGDACLFAHADWQVVPQSQRPIGLTWVRSWDLASTAPHASNPDPDYTRGVLLSIQIESDGEETLWIAGGVGDQWGVSDRDDAIRATAELDKRDTLVGIEIEPGSGGKSQLAYLTRLLRGYRVHGFRPTGSKEARLEPVIGLAERGRVKILAGDYVSSLLSEAAIYPAGKRDWWDAVSQGYEIARPFARRVRTSPRITKRVTPAKSSLTLPGVW